MTNQDQNPIDPKLIQLLEQLRPAPERDPKAMAAGKAKFLAEIESISRALPAKRRGVFGWFSRNHKQNEDIPMASKQRFAISVLTAFILGFVFLLGGAGATVYAAQSALPGDALYSVKTSLEQTQLTVSGNSYNQAQLHLGFAQRRLDEIARLIEEGRFRDVRRAAEAFEMNLQQAITAFQLTASNDPERAGELAGQIAAALSRYAQVLNTLAANAPEAVRADVEKALLTTLVTNKVEIGEQGEVEFTGVVESISPELWRISGRQVAIDQQTEIKGVLVVGDLVKVHARMGEPGSFIAREIELANIKEGEGELRFTGLVESINASAWQIAGRTVRITPQTEVRDTIAVGDLVEVRAVLGPDNSLAALRIKLEDDDDDIENANLNANENDNGNEGLNENVNGNDNENDNGNQNANDNGNHNGDDSNSNQNDVNSNDNDGNSNGNTNFNNNENGDDINTNINSAGNENDDDGNSNDNANSNQNDDGGNSGEGGGGGNDNGNENDGGDGGGSGGGNDNGNDDD